MSDSSTGEETWTLKPVRGFDPADQFDRPAAPPAVLAVLSHPHRSKRPWYC